MVLSEVTTFSRRDGVPKPQRIPSWDELGRVGTSWEFDHRVGKIVPEDQQLLVICGESFNRPAPQTGFHSKRKRFMYSVPSLFEQWLLNRVNTVRDIFGTTS